MDDGLSAAVRKVFVTLYKQGLIYRDKRLVNWDPKLQTAISDLEVEQREIKGKMWYFKYPVEGQPGAFVTVATTRPETMLGDTAVAVHGEDPRYQALIGKNVVLPIAERPIPIVADEHADPAKGTGAVKITPAHDFNDFEVGRRHSLPMVNVLDATAHMNENVPERYRGLDRFVARDKIVAEMESLGLLEKIEDNAMTLPYGDRSGVVIEPWLMDQWFVDAKTLAKPAIEAVETGKTTFVPKQWENTYYEWMRNIQPWCVSRQIWWGHQIPAWFGPDGHVFVEETEDDARKAAAAHYGNAVGLRRETDVLDTWFSSALWPFSTLGWPEKTPELERYYPTDVLVTGFDIIFFWVARMMMMGLHFMGEVPFRTVYIHALVRDEKGQKMSKSKGNVIDPLVLMDKYGTDSLRFTMTALAVQGRDVRMSESRVEGYRNFATKLWNAARFCNMNGCHPVPGFDPKTCRHTLNRWIVGKLTEASRAAAEAIESYRFNEAAESLYHFTWGTFCDWYVEIHQAGSARRRRGRDRRDAGHHGLGARPHPGPAPSRDALHHRGVVGSAGDARQAVDRLRMAGLRSGARRCRSQRRSRLGGAPDHPDPHRPRRDERSAGGAHSAPAQERGAGRAVASRILPALDLTARPSVRGGFRRRRDAQGGGPGRHRRGDHPAAACGRHRRRRREGPAVEGGRQARWRDRQAGSQARQCRLPRQGACRGGRGAEDPPGRRHAVPRRLAAGAAPAGRTVRPRRLRTNSFPPIAVAVIPAKAGIQRGLPIWIPAFAGMTSHFKCSAVYDLNTETPRHREGAAPQPRSPG